MPDQPDLEIPLPALIGTPPDLGLYPHPEPAAEGAADLHARLQAGAVAVVPVRFTFGIEHYPPPLPDRVEPDRRDEEVVEVRPFGVAGEGHEVLDLDEHQRPRTE